MNARCALLLLVGFAAACKGAERERKVELRWPAAEVPAAAFDLRYEVVVWRCAGGVAASELVRRERDTKTQLLVDTAGWPAEVCWSVRAHWSENGRVRCSRWLAAGQRPVQDACFPSACFAKL